MNNDSFTMIDNIISIYNKGLLSTEETMQRTIEQIDNYTWFINDIDIKIKAKNILYKRFFDKMHKAIIAKERRQ